MLVTSSPALLLSREINISGEGGCSVPCTLIGLNKHVKAIDKANLEMFDDFLCDGIVAFEEGVT